MVSAGRRGITFSGGPKASQRSPTLNAGKRKANGLVNPGDSTEPANRRPTPLAGSAPLPAFTYFTGKRDALGSRQLGSPEGGDVRGCIGRTRRPKSAKCVAEAHSHGFGHVRTRCRNRESQ